MNTQTISTLQVFQSLSRKCEIHFLQSCPKEFIRFLCKCIVNLLKRNLQARKRHHVLKFQDEIWLLLLERTTWKQRRNVLSSKKRSQLIAVLHLPSPIICPDMERIVLFQASVYNKSVTTQSVAKQELPKCKAEQPPTCQIDSLNRDIDKKVFGKADILMDKTLCRFRIKLPNSQTIILNGVDTGVLISNFTLHLRQ